MYCKGGNLVSYHNNMIHFLMKQISWFSYPIFSVGAVGFGPSNYELLYFHFSENFVSGHWCNGDPLKSVLQNYVFTP